MTGEASVASARSVWRVVVVDDNPDDRAEVRRMLLQGADRRYLFEEAETGRDAIRAVAKAPALVPHCLILDYYLPDMDALDVLAELAGPDGQPPCPVVVMTGAVGPETGKAVLHAGAQDYIGKDWLTPPALTRVVENAVDRFELTRKLRQRDAAVRESEAQLRLALEAAATGLWTWDLATDAVTYNAQCYELFGLTPETFSHTHAGCLELVHPDDRPRVVEGCERAVRDRALFEAEFRIVRGDGSVIWVAQRARADHDALGQPVRLLGTFVDITPRKRAEEETLRRLELQARLARIAESAPGMICSVDLKDAHHGTMPYASPAIADIFGLTAEQVARDYTALFDRVLRDDLPGLLRGIQAAIDGATAWHDKFRYLHPDRGELWLEGWASPGSREPGNAAWHGFVMDVTDRETAEASRRESERMARSILDSISSFVAVVDESGKVLAANRSWHDSAAHRHGPGCASNPDLCACELIAQAGPDLDRGIRDVLDARRDSAELECALDGPDGRRQYLARIVPFSGDGPRRAVVSFQDITDLKGIERQLRDEKERFETLAENINHFAWMADEQTNIYWYNRRFYEYTGADEAEAIGHGWTRYIHPDHVDRIIRSAREHPADGPWEETYPIRSKSGEYRWFLARAMPLRDASGRFVRWFGTNTDISDRMAMEDALNENDRRKDVFLAMLGHELRNPLASIRVASEVLGNPGDPAQADWARDVIHDQVDHLARLLEDLLDISRIARGAIRLETRPVDAVEVVHRAVEALRPMIQAQAHTLDLDLGLVAIPLEADPDRLEQVVSNLVGNAAKYTPTGGHIQVSAWAKDDEVIIRVRDNGAGIAADDLPRLFEPFVQGARTLDRSEGGLGIGLAVAAQLIRLHGGRIEARSDGPGTGSEFLVILPRGNARLADHAPYPVAPRKAPARVLIVDDNRELARGMGQLLGALGHNVELAFDGPSGIDAVRANPPDVLLLDLGLPIVDGYEVARTLRSDPTLQHMKIIAVSGYAQEDDRRRSAEIGIDHHLAKPVDLRALAELL